MNESINNGISFWSYLWTGFKVFLLFSVLGVIYFGIDALMVLFYKTGLLKLLWQLFNKTCTDINGVCTPNVGGFTMFVVLFFALLWLILSMWIGGWIARNVFKFE